MKVTIETVAPMRVAFARHVGPYNQCGLAWDKISEYLGKEGYLGPGCRFFGVPYDDPASVPAEQLRYDACITVGPDFKPAEGIGVMEIAGGTYARVTHQGPWQRFSETYGWLMGQWLPRNAQRLRDVPCFEEYLNSPENTAPEDLLTDIRVPIDADAAAQ